MSERSDVQDPMLEYAEVIGWERVTATEALCLRGGDTGPFFGDILERQLLALNAGVLGPAEIAEVLGRLRALPATIHGNREALAWLRGEMSVFVPGENRERNVRLIDFGVPGRNAFHVTDEWWQKDPRGFKNRADVVFLINGIPVAVAETKGATKRDAIALGVEQIRRYHRETPQMFTATQVFEVTHLIDFLYGVTWNTSRKNLFNWKEEEPGNYERKVRAFFDQGRFLDVLRDYIVFLDRDDELTKVILRQHQTRAVEKVLDRVLETGKRRGLVWHTQGSGKTLTMITIAARLLREGMDGGRPTVLMLVDRNELEQQLFKNIKAYGIGAMEVADSKADLRRLLRSGYRGLIVSMIHKFEGADAGLNTRDDIVVLVDEAHRTTGGDLGNYLMGALPNATYIGFTGTPIDNIQKGKGTFKVFGGDDPQGYLDKYSIAESIEDGTTVALNYALAPSDLLVDRETLEREFLSVAEGEGVTDIDELNAILDRAVELKEMMKAPTRVEKLAAFVAQHFRENVEPLGFKAFLVAVDREACALYKEALDKVLPPEMSEVVYSSTNSDSPLLKAHAQDADAEKLIRKTFAKKGTDPKILIVTEKLLTGYDAPILYCMYLDKPMRDHVLLQAIARVNRPYEDDSGLVKPYGFVLDFVGIFNKLERALSFDSDVVASVIQNIDVLKDLFAKRMAEEAPAYLSYAGGADDKAKERAIEHFADPDVREPFFTFYKRMADLYEILSPDAALRPFLEDYQALTVLYALLRNAYTPGVYTDKSLTAKTRELLRDRSVTTRLDLPGAIHELGPAELAALKRSDASDTVKVLNLSKVLTATVEKDADRKPFLRGIGERAEALAVAYEERQVDTKEALDLFEQLAQQVVASETERQAMGVDDNTYALYTRLREFVPDLTPAEATEVNDIFEAHQHYAWDAQQSRDLRTALYKRLVARLPKTFVTAVNALLRIQRV